MITAQSEEMRSLLMLYETRCPMKISKQEQRVYPNYELYCKIRAYLFFNVGRPLGFNTIAREIKEKFKEDNSKPSDSTIRRYLEKMVKQGELAKLKREYVKKSYTRENDAIDGSLSYEKLYFLKYHREELKEIFSDPCFLRLNIYHGAPNKGFEQLYRKNEVGLRLVEKYGDDKVKGGVLVYHYKQENKQDKKITICADFIVEEDGEKLVFMLSGMKTAIHPQKSLAQQLLLNAIVSIDRYSKLPVKIITIWDKEPTDPEYGYIKEVLDKMGYEQIPWSAI